MTGHATGPGLPRRLDGLVTDPGLRAAIGYWDSLRGQRTIPSRMDIDPGMLRPHLPDAAILEIARPGSVRIRLGGARVNALLGMDVRGLPLRALFDLSESARLASDIEAAILGARVLMLDVVSPAPRFGRAAGELLGTQIAILPMTDADLQPTRALYVMGPLSREIRRADTPHRWFPTRVHSLPLHAGEPVLAAPPALNRAERPAPARGSEAETEARGPLARARFRVIEGGLS